MSYEPSRTRFKSEIIKNLAAVRVNFVHIAKRFVSSTKKIGVSKKKKKMLLIRTIVFGFLTMTLLIQDLALCQNDRIIRRRGSGRRQVVQRQILKPESKQIKDIDEKSTDYEYFVSWLIFEFIL